MTLRLPRLLRRGLPALLAVCAACATREPGPATLSPPGLKPARPAAGRPKGPEYAVPQLALGDEGHVYLVWQAFEWRKSWDLLFSRSSDFGATWSLPPVSLKSKKGSGGGGVKIAAGPSGHVYVAWRNMENDKKQRELILVRSSDRGAHWEQPSTSLSLSQDMDVPHLLSEQGSGVSVAWLDGPESQRWFDVATSPDFGATFRADPIRLTAAFPTSNFGINRPRMASDGEGHLYVVWEEAKTAEDYRIYLNRSPDGGATWESQPILLNVPDPRAHGTRSPQIALGPKGRVYVVWEQYENRAVKPKDPASVISTDQMVYFNRSLDYGRTWLPQPIRVNQAGPQPVSAFQPQVSSDRGDDVYVIWLEAEGPYPRRVLFARSADSGVTWNEPQVRLDLTSPFGKSPAQPQIRSDSSGHVWALWQELVPKSNEWQVLLNRSDDHGRTWLAKAILLAAPPQRRGVYRGVSFQTDDRGHCYVAWDGGPGNDQEIYLNRSADFGATWLPREIQLGRQ